MAISLFCGQSSYPRTDSATANRYQALAEMTASLGYEVIFVNRHPVLRVNEPELPQPEFRTINVSGLRRESSWLKRQLVRLASVPREFIRIIKLKSSGSIAFVNIYSQFSLDLVFYYFVAKLVRAQCVLHVVECRSSFMNRSPILRLNDLVFEFFAPRLFVKFVAISTLIKNSIVVVNSGAKVVVIPPVCKFDRIAKIPRINRDRPYFLYCASLAYEDVAWFVIEAFLSAGVPNVDLILVLNGDPSDRIRNACEMNDAIGLFSQLDYDKLIGFYKGAHALLIPLRNIHQDIARYPQKITEYLASGRPIISCGIGEVGRHFTHGTDALLTDKYDVVEYAGMMKFSLMDSSDIESIAHKGLCLGAKLFDARAQVKNLQSLLKC
ncbi:glycosyltransferase [Azonexus sp.]|uniref:glycosyltransferase n=1 Tax=Azonexus sp. TaxID=1872668 RepID=UPI0035B364D1